jgi:hypothetical protein
MGPFIQEVTRSNPLRWNADLSDACSASLYFAKTAVSTGSVLRVISQSSTQTDDGARTAPLSPGLANYNCVLRDFWAKLPRSRASPRPNRQPLSVVPDGFTR